MIPLSSMLLLGIEINDFEMHSQYKNCFKASESLKLSSLLHLPNGMQHFGLWTNLYSRKGSFTNLNVALLDTIWDVK